MHKRSRSSAEREKSNEDKQPKYQLYNYDSLEWSWAHITILITLGLLVMSNMFGDAVSNGNNPYTEMSYREKRSVLRSKKYAKRNIVGNIFDI